ncbi:MAG: hypothetical protein U0992_03195 [Planctomycetaceae bacterium]
MRRDILLALFTVCLIAAGVGAVDDFDRTESSRARSAADPNSAAVEDDVDRNPVRRPVWRRELPVEQRLRQIERAIDRLASQIEELRHSGKVRQPALTHSRRHEEGFRGLYRMNRDGTDPQFLIAAPDMIATSDAALSSDGRFLAMNGLPRLDAFHESRIFVNTLTGPDAGAIRDLGYGNTPAWSPDDSQIAFMLNPGNPGGFEGGLWIMHADGSNRRRIANAWWPRWSPDGTLLCCHGWRNDGRPSLVFVDLDTAEVDPLFENTDWTLVDYAGCWSPDGKRVAFVGERNGAKHLATIAADGATDSIRILYTNEDPQLDMFGPPSWSRDGRQLIFSMQSSGPAPRRWWKSNLYSMAPDVPCAPVLLEGRRVGNINRMPTWTPDSAQIIFSSER